MLSHNDLKKGVIFIYNNQPYEVVEYSLSFKGRGHSTAQTKIKNLITGNVTSQNFKPSETFEPAELEKINLSFVYSNRDKYIFADPDDASQRIELTKDQVGESADLLKENQQVEGIKFNGPALNEVEGKIINISLPVKISLKVVQAPPTLKSGRADAGTKQVTLETGAKINAPVFVNESDIIEINTQTREYVRRVE